MSSSWKWMAPYCPGALRQFISLPSQLCPVIARAGEELLAKPDDAAGGIEAGGDEIPFAREQRDAARQRGHIALAAAEPDLERATGVEHQPETAGERLAPRAHDALPAAAGQRRP